MRYEQIIADLRRDSWYVSTTHNGRMGYLEGYNQDGRDLTRL
jgi:hypothetical protein